MRAVAHITEFEFFYVSWCIYLALHTRARLGDEVVLRVLVNDVCYDFSDVGSTSYDS